MSDDHQIVDQELNAKLDKVNGKQHYFNIHHEVYFK